MQKLEVGDEVGAYRIVGQLHGGGMAGLYLVRQTGSEETRVMKVPRLGHGEPVTGVVGFEVEQMLMPALSGEHVPRFFANGESGSVPYIVMELIEGPSLQAWAEQAEKSPLSLDEVADLVARTARAAHDLHRQDVVHLDLKPGNILFRVEGGGVGQAVLIDFGLAHHAAFPDLLVDEFARPMGTAAYIAPEQVLGVRCDPRSDVFALGVMLYQLATGRLPFGAPTSARGLRRRLWADPPLPRRIRQDIPEWMQEIILRCLEPDARLRYQTAAQLAFDLKHPDQVLVGDRGKRQRQRGVLTRLRLWLRAAGFEPAPCPPPSHALRRAPVILVAVATLHNNEGQFAAIREAVRGLATSHDEARLACVTVIPPAPALESGGEDETATAQHVQHLLQLKHWAEPLALPRERLSFHVLEADDVAQCLLHHAEVVGAEQVVLGAPPPRLGPSISIAARVAAAAPCSVTVVRARREETWRGTDAAGLC